MKYTIKGRVISGPIDRPIANASVSIVSGPAPAPDIAALTDARGTFAFPGLSPGDWVLRALSPSGRTGLARVQVPTGDRPVIIRLSDEIELLTDEEN